MVKLLSPHAKKPARGSESAAGYDLYCAENTPVIIPPRTRKLIDTGIAIATPGIHLYARIAPRSGLSVKGLDIGAGVVDADYRGSVKVLLINSGNTPFQINPGDRMAQLILEHIKNPECVLVDSLPVTNRGTQGFGSTGLATADLGCGDPMVIPVAIKNKKTLKPALAMIDSGASTQFIDPEFAQGLRLQLDPKSVPESSIVVDGRRAAPLTHTCTLDLLIDQHLETVTFQVTKLAGWQMILGKTWLKKHNPIIDWTRNSVTFASGYCQAHCLPVRHTKPVLVTTEPPNPAFKIAIISRAAFKYAANSAGSQLFVIAASAIRDKPDPNPAKHPDYPANIVPEA